MSGKQADLCVWGSWEMPAMGIKPEVSWIDKSWPHDASEGDPLGSYAESKE